MTQEELKLVLDALKWCHGGEPCGTAEAIAVVEKALANVATNDISKEYVDEMQKQRHEQEPVAWGVDWGKAGDIPCVSIIKRLPDGGIKVLAVEYAPYSYTTSPKQEPVAWRWENGGKDKWLNKYIYLDNGAPDYPEECEPLYTIPPQRSESSGKPAAWVGLTDEEVRQMCGSVPSMREAVRETEAKLKEKNT